MNWNEQRLLEVLSQLRAFGDDTTLIECKRAAEEVPENLAKTICAFANMPQTGTIILGVDERRGFEVTGVANPAKMIKAVTQISRTAVDPSPQVNCLPLKVQNRDVVVVEVLPLMPQEKPATVKGVPYLRQADGDYAMNANDLRMLQLAALAEGKTPQYDFESLPGTDTALLDAKLLASYVRIVRDSSPRLGQIEEDERVLQMTGVTDAAGNIRRGGLYAMGYLPQAQEPALGATAAVRLARDGSGIRNKNLKEIEGPVPVMLQDAMLWVRRNTDTVSRYNDSGNLVDTPEFPTSAVREVIANALVHRDLGPSLDTGKKIEIRVTDRALVVVNPGGLRGISVDQLGGPALAKSAVNKRLYEMARSLRLDDDSRVIEGEGGGIQEIVAALREARLPRPQFIDTGVEFKVVFPRGSRFSPDEDSWLESLQQSVGPLTPNQEDLLVNLRAYGPAERSRIIADYRPMSDKKCTMMLEKLEALGVVEEDAGIYSLVSEGGETMRHPRREPVTASEDRSEEVGQLSKNALPVYASIRDGAGLGKSLREIELDTQLAEGQVRYALRLLIDAKFVIMIGGRGKPETRYYLAATA